MEYLEKIRLRDGRECILRNGVKSDGTAALTVFILTHEQTDFLLSYPDESTKTVEQEGDYLQAKTDSSNEIEILAVVDGVVAGLAGIDARSPRQKLRHRADLGISIDRAYWGQGIVPEAVMEMLRHAFEDIGMTKVWVGYYEGNAKSKRVQEKCGFRYQWKSEGVDVPLMHEKRTGHVSSMTKDQWQWDRLYSAAKSVRNERRISEYVTCGEVSAAILSGSGRIYTGVCIDTCSTLGICAERNAIFNMITNGEQEIEKVIAILPDGSSGAPCGACRELMVQLMPEKYKDIQIMMDYKQERIMTLGELTPEWWIK